MTNKTYLFIASVCTSIAAVANQFAREGEPVETTPGTGAIGATGPTGDEPEKTDKPKRGRPAKTEAPAEPEAPATPGPAKAEPTTKEYSDQDLRDAAAKLIEDGRGADVKKLIVKHGGSDKLATVPAASRVAFVRDLEALDM